MKITRQCSIFTTGRKELTMREAIDMRLSDCRDYYGGKLENSAREVEELGNIIGKLCQVLVDQKVLNEENISDILGYGFEVK